MNTWLRVLTLLIAAAILQSSIFTEIRIDGMGVELLLLISILSGYHGGPIRGAHVSFWAGLVNDCVVASPLGIHALVYPIIAVAVSNLEERFLNEKLIIRAFGVALAVATGVLLTATVGHIFGEKTFNTDSLPETAIIAGVMTTFFSKPISRIVNWTVSSGMPQEVTSHFAGGSR
ncbi:MAG: rod shape-determining protein MreD [Dehalococcoidia bacterium]|nr:rod shape-determining protein MreD [Dehalococcoidia bacterium]